MDVPQAAHTCRFATPTLFLQWPYWLDAWSWAWGCTEKEGQLRLLPTDAVCPNCTRWGLRRAGATPPAFDTAMEIIKG